VVDVDPDAPEAEPLPFLVVGWLDKALPMAIEMKLKLPKGTDLLLELPLRFLHNMGTFLEVVKVDPRHQIALARLPSWGRVLVGRGEVPAKARYKMRLSVKLPPSNRNENLIGQVVARQLFINSRDEKKAFPPEEQTCCPCHWRGSERYCIDQDCQ